MRLLDPAHQAAAIELAAQRLAAGGRVALPTETVYGLGARADRDEAVARIFAAKGRPADHPLIVHVPNQAAALYFVTTFPPVAQPLAEAFRPGPLAVIGPRHPDMARAAAGGQDTIGLRCPDHPVARQLLEACAQKDILGIAAPSANRFGRISPTRASHVVDEFRDQGEGLDEVWVLDGGACEVGIESTIVDCSRDQPVLLRPGRLTLAELEAAAGEPLLWSKPEAPDPEAPRASGTLLSHYAPSATLPRTRRRAWPCTRAACGRAARRTRACCTVRCRAMPPPPRTTCSPTCARSPRPGPSRSGSRSRRQTPPGTGCATASPERPPPDPCLHKPSHDRGRLPC